MVKRLPGKSGPLVVVARFRWMFHTFGLSAFREFLENSREITFSMNVSHFGPSRSPLRFFRCLFGHPWAVRSRLMFHTLGLLGQFVLHAIRIFNKRCTSWFRIQYYSFATSYNVWSLTLCLLFAVASNGEVPFSMTVSSFRRVQHRLWRFTFF